MKLDVARLRRNDPEAIRETHEACMRYAKVGARIVGMPDFADDVAQEMFMKIVSPGFLDDYDPERDIDAWMVKYAEYAAKGVARKLHWHRECQSERLEMEPAEEGDLDEQLAAAEGERRAESAKRRLRQQAQGRVPATPHVNAGPVEQNQSDRIARWQAEQRARPAVKEIAAHAQRLGLTHRQLAALFGVSLHHLRSVLYGRIAGRPNVMLQKLRDFEEKEPAVHATTALFTAPIQQQMVRWRDRLRLSREPGWHQTLAETLGVHRTTMYRWKTGKASPTPSMMRFLESCVEAHVSQNALRNQIHPQAPAIAQVG